MGILAVVDTFLIYKIAEWRYNRNVAFIAAILFAVMPYTWLIRRVLIEPIQLPFLLTSILFALYSGLNARQKSKLKEIKKVKSREENEEIKVREREGEKKKVKEKIATTTVTIRRRLTKKTSFYFYLQASFWD